jgi:predicted acylesterase/phospholipase RssA
MDELERGFCDLVMQGGLTSGIVYPQAVLELSRKYSFKNIGGTSAGAIAAAVTAAAELGRRRSERRPDESWTASQRAGIGMTGLATVAQSLASPGFIYGLFQPAASSGPAFRLLVTLSGRGRKGSSEGHQPRKAGGLASVVGDATPFLRFLFSMRPALLLGLLIAPVLIGGLDLIVNPPHGWGWALAAPVAILFLVMTTVFGAAIASVFSVLGAADAVRHNFMGMCSGTTIADAQCGPGLTDWMHEVTCALAGSDGQHPVLFSDLWNAPQLDGEPDGKTIKLAMITTDASHQQPRTLPSMGPDFWFCDQEFSRLFPLPIMTALRSTGGPAVHVGGRDYYRMPPEGQLPIVVAARMSLSFPILISAIPLHQPDPGVRKSEGSGRPAPDKSAANSKVMDGLPGTGLLQSVDALAQAGRYDEADARADVRPDAEPTKMQVRWFTDGGASSNFPLDLFDAPLPRWPTFAIDLVYPDATLEVPGGRVFLPTIDAPVAHPRYVRIERKGAVGQLGTFLFSIVATMQNWRDSVQERAPGQRDRVVSIFLKPGEGGLNLNMSADVLKSAAAKGGLAGRKLATDFNFANHRQIRSRLVMACMQEFGSELTLGIGGPVRPAGPMNPADGPYPLDPAQEGQAADLEDCVVKAAGRLTSPPGLEVGSPQPRSVLKISPTF